MSAATVVIATTVMATGVDARASSVHIGASASAPQIQPVATAVTPVLVAGSYRGRRPATIDISGDAGNIVTHLRWSRWSSAGATATGTSAIQSCVPSCAQGTERQVRTTIQLRNPRHGSFRTLVEHRAGRTETFRYTPHHHPDDWPGAAS